MKYKSVIFDMDGTILDTLEDLARSTNYALINNNLPLRKVFEVKKFVGNGMEKLIERAVPAGTEKETINKVVADFKEYYKEHCKDNTGPYPGITELLWQLKNDGIKIAVVSNKPDFAVQELCRQYFTGLFDAAIGERKNVRRKPAPDSINEVLSKLKIEKKDTVYIGDSEVDIETTKNAGINVIAVLWGFRDRKILEEAGATDFVSNVQELWQKITE